MADRLKIRCQIDDDDPDLDKLSICRYFYYPPDRDWERDGISLGRNTQIKELRLGAGLRDFVRRDEIRAFCSGLYGNESIERLNVYCNQLFGGEIFNILLPFFEQIATFVV